MSKSNEELYNDYLALDQIGAIVDRINRYRKMLSIKPKDDLSDEEKLWQLTCNGLDLEFKAGTEDALTNAAQLAVLVESTIPESYK